MSRGSAAYLEDADQGIGGSGKVKSQCRTGAWVLTLPEHFPGTKKSAARGRRSRYCNPSYSRGMISSATMLMILINGLMAGPAVSL